MLIWLLVTIMMYKHMTTDIKSEQYIIVALMIASCSKTIGRQFQALSFVKNVHFVKENGQRCLFTKYCLMPSAQYVMMENWRKGRTI